MRIVSLTWMIFNVNFFSIQFNLVIWMVTTLGFICVPCMPKPNFIPLNISMLLTFLWNQTTFMLYIFWNVKQFLYFFSPKIKHICQIFIKNFSSNLILAYHGGQVQYSKWMVKGNFMKITFWVTLFKNTKGK